MDEMRKSIMISQFMQVTGSTFEDASNSLKSTNFQLESALSMFFQGQMLPSGAQRQQIDPMCAPCNTPATPPNFSDALLSFSKMSTASPVNSGATPGRNQTNFKTPQAFPENHM